MDSQTISLSIISIEPNVCPACGAENRCAVAEGLPPRGCWCMTAEMPMAMLIALPAEFRGTRCVCKNCVDHWNRTGELRRYVAE